MRFYYPVFTLQYLLSWKVTQRPLKKKKKKSNEKWHSHGRLSHASMQIELELECWWSGEARLFGCQYLTSSTNLDFNELTDGASTTFADRCYCKINIAMGQSLVRPSQLFHSVEGVAQPTASEAASWSKLFLRIAGTFAGTGTVLLLMVLLVFKYSISWCCKSLQLQLIIWWCMSRAFICSLS